MGKTAIVTGGTHKDVFAMGALALNIREITSDLADELIIFHDGISEKEQQIIKQIFPTKFVRYNFSVGFWAKRRNSSLRYFSPMVFCKYECFRLLQEYDRVIWTDYDIVIVKELKELVQDNAGLQIVEDSAPMKRMFFENAEQGDFREFDLEKRGVCTPLFVLTREIGNYQKYYDWCNQETLKYAPYIYLPEQCIISMLIQKFHISYTHLPAEKYALHPNSYDGKASIIHAYGRPKFWEGLSNEQWNKYYTEWISAGGRPYKKPIKEKLIEAKTKLIG